MTSAGLSPPLDRHIVITALGIAQILAWGTSFYFPAVFAASIVADTGFSLGDVVSGTSIGLLIGGLISPQIGKLIDSYGGRPSLVASSILYAAGLTGIGLSQSLSVYFVSWTILGLGMGAGLYDAAFATLGRMYGYGARGPITNLTLFGGFSSTICWPLSAFLIESMGWRNACFVYAALHLFLSLPLQAWVVRDMPKAASHANDGENQTVISGPAIANEALVIALLALVMSIMFGIGAIVVVHLLNFLQATGLDFATAVALGTLFGPAQVAARIAERLFGSQYHPLWTLIASCIFMTIGLAMLFGNVPALILTILIYGGGYGVSWIARGTVPLALFGPIRFPRLMGKLAFPSLIGQSMAPALGAWLIEAYGAHATLGLLTVVALTNVVLVAALWAMCRRTMDSNPLC